VAEHAARADPSQLQVYALDMGGGLAGLSDLPHCGAVAGPHERGSVTRVVRHVAARRGTGPHVVLLVDDIGRLRREHPDEEAALAELAVGGRANRVHLVMTAGRWLDVRSALLDSLDLRLELRLSEPTESVHGRAAAAHVPALAGRGLDPVGRSVQLATTTGYEPVRSHPEGIRARAVRPLPLAVREPVRCGSESPDCFALGISEPDHDEVHLDLLAPGTHLVVVGDHGSGRSTVLRRLAGHLAGRADAGRRVRLQVVDPARSLLDLAGLAVVGGYAYEPVGAMSMARKLAAELDARRPPPGLTPAELASGSWWSGPDHVLLVDDADLLTTGDPAPLAPLAGTLPFARDVGLHVVVVRTGAGAARANYDPFWAGLRGSGGLSGLVLSGDRADGQVIGSVAAAPMPPGRARFVAAGRTSCTVQLFLPATDARS
jgi:S-DNA-T family DNA segregation ATPase FtsK/SpoIIIE